MNGYWVVDKEYDFVVFCAIEYSTGGAHSATRWLRAQGTSTATDGRRSPAFVGGGLWCMRYRAGQIPKKTIGAVVAVLLLLIVAMSAGTFVDANAPPPILPIAKTVLVHGIEVQVRIFEVGEEVQLIVPPAIADKIQGK